MYTFEEPFHWKEALATAISFLFGIGLIISSFENVGAVYEDVGLVVGGLAIIVVSIVAFSLTGGWKHANDLPTGQKIIAYLLVVLTGIVFIVVIVSYYIFKEVTKDTFNTK